MNKHVDKTAPIAETQSSAPPALLFEMLRSFVVLSETLNLSHAVQQLGSTRQTVRRHIASLEEIKGGELFDLRDRRYMLTELGEQILPEARELVITASSWFNGISGVVDGLQYLKCVNSDGWFFFQQQKPIGSAFSSSGTDLQAVLAAWATAGGKLEHEALREVRPACNVFRRFEGNLMYAEVGEKSSFFSWFGESAARSSVGRSISHLPGGVDFGLLIDKAYEEVEATQSIRLDHVHTLLPFQDTGKLLPISYERLMLSARFPDESEAIISFVRRTYDIDIKDVTPLMARQMAEDMVMP